MAREEEDPAVLCVGVEDALFSLELHARQHLLWSHRAELQEHGEQPAEMRKHLAADGVAFALASHGKRRPQVVDREPAVASIEPVERAAKDGPGRKHHAHGQQADGRHDADHGQVLEPVADGRLGRCRRGGWERLLVSQRCREPRAASRPASAGTRGAGRVPL